MNDSSGAVFTDALLIQRYVRPEQVKGRRRKPYSYHCRVIYL
jgi:hypothetical protein